MSWKDLDIKDEIAGEVDYANIPEERGGGLPDLLQPGTYLFKLPDSLENSWTTMNTQKGQRVALKFKDPDPLVVVKVLSAAVNGKPIASPGDFWYGQISGLEMNIAPFGEPEFLFPELGRLLQILGSQEKIKNGENTKFVKEVNKYGGASFIADNDWSVSLQSKKGRVRRIWDAEANRSVEDPTGKIEPDFKAVTYKGKHFQIPRDPETGLFVQEFQANDAIVEDGVVVSPPTYVRCFQNLKRFRAAS